MLSTHRLVEVEAGTKLRLRLGQQDDVKPGKVQLCNGRRGDLAVDQRRWDDGMPV
jgi:hypothetical protein